MNIASNPWSFTSADPATAVIGAGTVTLNADGTVTVVSGAALTFNAGAATNTAFTLTGVTNALYNGFYYRISGASGQTTFVLQPQFSIPAGTAASTTGNITQCLYPWQVRAEDISWQKPAAAADTLDFRDRSGNVIWQAVATQPTANATTGSASQNRGKLFWFNGFSPITLASGIVLITVN